MPLAPTLERLISALKCLPGVGPKTAERMAFHLLERDQAGGERLSETLAHALKHIVHCQQCRMLTDELVCHYCQDPKRDGQLLCVVETPADVLVLEQSGAYRGRYFVLGGHLSPLDGIGPDDIGIADLMRHIMKCEITEVILATNSTVEGEATAYYIVEQLKPQGITVSRIAQGVPRGGELAYVDGGTLSQALNARVVF